MLRTIGLVLLLELALLALPGGVRAQLCVRHAGASCGATATDPTLEIDQGLLRYHNFHTWGPSPLPHYLDGLPTVAVNQMGYVDDPNGTLTRIYYWVDDFGAGDAGFSLSPDADAQTSRYTILSKGANGGYTPLSYLSGAVAIQTGSNTSAPGDSMTLYTPVTPFKYTVGRRLWFSANVTTYYGSRYNAVGLPSFKPRENGITDFAQPDRNVTHWYNPAATLDPPVVPFASSEGASGSVTAGTHSYKVTATNAAGETTPSDVSNTITADGSNKQFGIGGSFGESGATGYKVYRTAAGNAETGPWLLLATLSGEPFGGGYTDTHADGDLGVDEPPVTNTATGLVAVTGLFFFRTPGESDWTFYAIGDETDGTKHIASIANVRTLALGAAPADQQFVELSFRVMPNGDVNVYADGKGVGTIDHTDAALTWLADRDAAVPATVGTRGFALGVATDTTHIAATMIDHVLIAGELPLDAD
jgi:hypothetical protein